MAAVLSVAIQGCDKKEGTVTPGSEEAYRPETVTDWYGEVHLLEYDADGRLVKSLNKNTNSYMAYRYEPGRIVRSYYSSTTQNETDDITYLLNSDGKLTEYISPISFSGGSSRRFNFSYDAEGHVLSYESEGKNASGNRTYYNRHEFTWKDGNLVRSRQTDLLSNNNLLNDRTYEYDLSRINTLFPQSQPNRTTFGTNDPNFNLGFLAGKGPKNVVLKDKSTADPSKFGEYAYTFDGEGRISVISYFGDKITITY